MAGTSPAMTPWAILPITHCEMPMKMFSALIAALIGTFALAAPAWSQAFPSRTVHLVVSYAPGGTGDIVARLISDRLAAALGQSVVVENRAGASGAIGAQSVVSAAPDGHTLLIGQPAEVAINPHWIKGLSYDPDRDLQPVALATVVPLALVIPGSAPYATVADMIKAAATRPLTFASAGTGTPGHFAGELLKFRTKSNKTHVPYKGAGPALNDLLGAHVDFFFSGFPAAVAQVKAGTLKLIAVSTAKRSPAAPDVPTVAEAAGIADFDIGLWQGVFAPRATPKDVVLRLNAEINKIVSQPDITAKLRDDGADVTPLGVDQFTAFVKTESKKYLEIIRQSGVTPE
jgi:tripartite-type tricarboxylate transporter receptor subunit TctC